MKTSVNFTQYLSRMEGVKDKDLLTAMVPEGARVLDFGCGAGQLALEFHPNSYVGYDLSEEMVKHCRTAHPEYAFTSTLEGVGTFDFVLYSSILHEVFAYSNLSMDAVRKTLFEAHALLSPGGSILIRDGVAPPPPWSEARLTLLDPLRAKAFLKYVKNRSPFTFDLTVEDGLLIGDPLDVVHFLNVHTWGWRSVDRELFERVNFLTVEEWQSLLQECGYEVESLEVITQADYFHHLSKIVKLDGVTWPTKVLIKASPLQ